MEAIATNEFIHSFQDNFAGEIVYRRPWRFVYTWATHEKEFRNVVKYQAMKTGCVALHFKDRIGITVVSPGYLYCTQEPE